MTFVSVFTHSRYSFFSGVRVYYRLMDVPAKAMYTASTHNILLESLISDV